MPQDSVWSPTSFAKKTLPFLILFINVNVQHTGVTHVNMYVWFRQIIDRVFLSFRNKYVMLVKVQARLCFRLHTPQGCSVNHTPLRQLLKSHITKSQTHLFFFFCNTTQPQQKKILLDIIPYCILFIFFFFYARLAKLSPGCMVHVVAHNIAATTIILF